MTKDFADLPLRIWFVVKWDGAGTEFIGPFDNRDTAVDHAWEARANDTSEYQYGIIITPFQQLTFVQEDK